MPRNEKETRLELIDPKLRKAGWTILNGRHIVEPGKCCIETPVTGMARSSENPSGNGFVDYVLFGDNGKPLALVEAKKSINNEEQGAVQAKLYADCLERMYGVRPVIYYTNGYNIKIVDGIYPARIVFGFHTKDELQYIIQKRNFRITDREVRPDICDRYYQKDAIEEVMNHLESKHSRSLIVLATGTGKTRVSCAISDILLRNNCAKRILFLADRVNLVRQAKEECFDRLLDTVPSALICEGNREGNESQARIVFSTYQSMLSIIKDTSVCPYGIGYFDFLIVDEAHRSLFNKYAEIFEYFDCLMIGLTATPRNDIHKSTYKVFNLDTEMPNYEYDLIKGVQDGFLTYYRALDRTPDILKNGLKYEELDAEEKEQYEDLFTDDEGDIPPVVEGEKFYSIITNIDTIREVLKMLMEEGIRVNHGDTLGKTIIFARDHNHAIKILECFREMYPEYTLNRPNGVDYAVVIDNKIRYNDVLQREFKEKQDIRIVISVDMMDTGVDIPEVVNLVFFKKVLSKIKFWQMIGRGTRLCKGLYPKSPSKAYFERFTSDGTRQIYEDKQGFLIFDVCGVFSFFQQNPDGKVDNSESEMSMSQKIFFQKVKLFKALQAHYGSLSEGDKEMYSSLLLELAGTVKTLNKNTIGVQSNLQYVEKYSNVHNWENFGQDKFVEVKKHIVRLVDGVPDLQSCKVFDYICFKFSESKFTNDTEHKKTAKSIYAIAKYLLEAKLHIDEVKSHEESLRIVSSQDFLNHADAKSVDMMREELRMLTRYIEKDLLEPIISDFNDSISSTGDAENEHPFSGDINLDEFKTLAEKVQNYLVSHPDIQFVKDIRNFVKPSKSSFLEIRKAFVDLAKSAEEFNDLFTKDGDITNFVRKNVRIDNSAIDRFIAEQMDEGLNIDQLRFVRTLLVFISENGKFERADLLREELDFRGIFNNIEISKLISDIEARL
ncbi:MAG: DEAD/DEAH box helicase family protein [Bacilli bacterium]|nr:DEAD/DEAH box helicase family protein [Bacilli bacterium]